MIGTYHELIAQEQFYIADVPFCHIRALGIFNFIIDTVSPNSKKVFLIDYDVETETCTDGTDVSIYIT